MPKPKHIAVLAFPFGTHAPPLLTLVRRLAEQLPPDTHFSFLSTQQSNAKLFGEGSDDDHHGRIKPFNVRDGLPAGYVLGAAGRSPQEPVELFLKATPDNFKEGMKAAVEGSGGREVSCIITDAFLWFAADVAKELCVPWVPLWTAGPRSVLLHIETDLLRRNLPQGVHGGEEEDRTIDFLPGFSAIRVADLPPEVLSEDLTSGFPGMLHKMGLMLPRATAVVSNSFEELECPELVTALKSRLENFLDVGPLAIASPPPETVSDPQGCLDWLDRQRPGSVAYISFGTVISPPPHELAALGEALEEAGIPFLWSFRGNPEEKLPKEFLERSNKDMTGKIVSWAPQVKVLQHAATGVFVTHGGWNSVSESIIGCVPLICRPFFGDQRLNARTVEAVWGTGVGLQDGKLTKDGVTKALKSVLFNEEGKKMRSKLHELKERAFGAVQPNGSSTRNFKTLVEIINN